MTEETCCVCENHIHGGVIDMGHRHYCADCHAKVTSNRKGLWWASMVEVVALVLFVALVAFIVDRAQPQLQGLGLVVVGLILAVVPAVIWLAFFYAQDVREPEPKHLVLGVFLLGALLARAVGVPLVKEVFRAPDWLATGALYHVLGSILVVGFVQQFLVYAAVRYSVYNSEEFDERVDGIIYATAAGLGYATLVNVQYVVESGGVDLVAGVIRITVTAMALASFGGLLGYFLGRCKFEDEPAWWMPVGLIVAAVLDGLFTYFRGELTTTAFSLTGGGYSPWPGLILGAVVAAITFSVLFLLIWRLRRRAPKVVGA